MGRLAPICNDRPVPTGLMVLAGILCLFVPALAMIPYSVLFFETARETPQLIELFAYMGWIFGLFALPFALFLAHLANRDGVNGWLPTIVGGAGLGALAAVFLGGLEPLFLGLCVALGTAYALSFWALAHGMAHLRDRKAPS